LVDWRAILNRPHRRWERSVSEPIHVVVSTDAGFAMQAAVLIASLRAHGDDDYVVHVLHDGLDDELRARIAASPGGAVEIEWLDARSERFANFKGRAPVAPAILFRLRMAELFQELPRLVYLDADIIVLSSLRELWEVPLGDNLVAAVRDVGFPSFAGIVPWRELHAPPDAPYFNSGVMLLSPQRWLEHDVGGRALELGAQHTFKLRDQCALNVVCMGSWYRLPARWNVQRGHFRRDGPPWSLEGVDALTDAQQRPAIMHFCNPRWNRPWLVECDHPYRDEWFALLQRTPWAGWAPAKRPITKRVQRQLRQVKRALLTDPDRSPWS
jgi:lipopolysaccharide biosynthesis glycosyltransferase